MTMNVFKGNGNNSTSILLVNLEGTTRRSLSFCLGGDTCQVTEADSVDAALSVLAESSINVVLISSGKHKSLSLEVVRKIKQNSPDTEIVVMTASPDTQLAVRALQAGAFDYFDTMTPPEQLILKLHRAAEHSRLKRELHTLHEKIVLCEGFDSTVLVSGRYLDSRDITLARLTPPHKNGDNVEDLLGKRTGSGLLHDSQQAVILKALADNNWNFTHTARELGIGRTTLWRKMKKYNLKREPADKY